MKDDKAEWDAFVERNSQRSKKNWNERSTSNIPEPIQQLDLNRSIFCNHSESSCIKHSVIGALNSFKYGVYLRCFTTAIMLLMRRTSIMELIRNPMIFLRVPLFLGLQSFIYKIVLCIMRRLRGKEDGINSFVSGCLSGLSVLIYRNDQNTKKLIALYMMIRVFRIVLDIFDSKGKVTEEGIHQGFLAWLVFMSFIFTTLYMVDNKVLKSS